MDPLLWLLKKQLGDSPAMLLFLRYYLFLSFSCSIILCIKYTYVFELCSTGQRSGANCGARDYVGRRTRH